MSFSSSILPDFVGVFEKQRDVDFCRLDSMGLFVSGFFGPSSSWIASQTSVMETPTKDKRLDGTSGSVLTELWFVTLDTNLFGAPKRGRKKGRKQTVRRVFWNKNHNVVKYRQNGID